MRTMRWVLLPLVVAAVLSACTSDSSEVGSNTNPPIASTALACGPAARVAAAQALIQAWNAHDAGALQGALTPDVLGDISRKGQGVESSGPGVAAPRSYEILNGFEKVLSFAQKQWALGETLSYDRIKPAGTGGYIVGLQATYGDGSKQTFTDSKFAYSCSVGAIEHFLQVASAPAS